MYWRYKAVLIAVLVAIAVGLGFLIWRSLPEGVTKKVADVTSQPFDRPADSARDTERDIPSPPREGVAEQELPSDVSPPPPRSDTAEAEARLASSQKQFEEENLVAARELALRVLGDPAVTEFDRLWYRAAQLVSEIDATFMNSEAPCPEKVAYTIESGDSLSRIASKHDTTVGALQRLNNLDPTSPVIYPGSVLYMLRCDWSIRVVKSEFVLLLKHGGILYRMYRVGIGRQNRTPVGVFDIYNKVLHPAWTPPGKHIPYGDPENVLGTHWLGLRPVEDTSPTLKGYGIHGTWQPETVGTAASAGCVRMTNEDVAELFDFIPKPRTGGTRVRVAIED